MKVRFVDLNKMHEPIKEELHNAAIRVIDSANYIGGTEVELFEKEMARWLGTENVCSCGCATDGLFAVLKAMGIGPGDEVITTVHTAIATAEAITLTGAQVVFCDLAEDSFNLDLDQVEKKITTRTRAFIPVHLYGHPVEMDRALSIAKKYGLFLVEDCAQAQGAKYKGKKVGTMGDAGVFSFFPSKNLGGFGDGGAVTARDASLFRKIKMFVNHGREGKFDHEFEGMNSRLDAIQAALLRVCLPNLDTWNEGRRRVAAEYDEGLKDISQVRTSKVIPDTEPVYHLYVIITPHRDALIKHLQDNGIESGIHYPRSLNLQPAYQHLNQGRGSYPRAEYACDHMLSLPMSHVVTREEIKFVCESISEFYSKNDR
ncbi:MAG: DegT/DnrJ/EryC1/StrS family aminotransferase [Deltaproteobacteria bacterium]|nr:DegT/DnrJ/EryC1/StrS family aminotransferase [Deltaproteobacteria bacterium]